MRRLGVFDTSYARQSSDRRNHFINFEIIHHIKGLRASWPSAPPLGRLFVCKSITYINEILALDLRILLIAVLN
jgi:hypothetical protein